MFHTLQIQNVFWCEHKTVSHCPQSLLFDIQADINLIDLSTTFLLWWIEASNSLKSWQQSVACLPGWKVFKHELLIYRTVFKTKIQLVECAIPPLRSSVARIWITVSADTLENSYVFIYWLTVIKEMSLALLHFPTDGFSKGTSSEVVDFDNFETFSFKIDSYYTGLSSGG